MGNNMKNKDTNADWSYKVHCRVRNADGTIEKPFEVEWGMFKNCTRKEAQDSVDALARKWAKEYVPVAGVQKPQFYGTTKKIGEPPIRIIKGKG